MEKKILIVFAKSWRQIVLNRKYYIYSLDMVFEGNEHYDIFYCIFYFLFFFFFYIFYCIFYFIFYFILADYINLLLVSSPATRALGATVDGAGGVVVGGPPHLQVNHATPKTKKSFKSQIETHTIEQPRVQINKNE